MCELISLPPPFENHSELSSLLKWLENKHPQLRPPSWGHIYDSSNNHYISYNTNNGLLSN